MNNLLETSPVIQLQSLSAVAKESLLFALIQELIETTGGHGLIPFVTPDGQSLGYYVPPEAEKVQNDRMLAELPEGVRQEMTKALPIDFDADDCLSNEKLAEFKQAASSRIR